jgi:class 3 adenylate cyclase
MFCDLADSMALSRQLDPEDLREVIRAYQATAAAMIQQYGGSIAQYLGDGRLVYFGWPQAHEDDAQRAVHAGLGIVEALVTLNTRLAQETGVRLAVRIGIHIGPVVIGEMGSGGRHEQLALGETPNIAARLESLAQPDTVVMSETVWRLIDGYFTCDALGSHPLKGLATPMPVYRVRGRSDARTRLDAVASRGLTPLVGREQELGLLLECWRQVHEGMGQVVLLSGEAGLGKSRLVQVLKDQAGHAPYTLLECHSAPYCQHTALYPVLELWPRLLHWHADDSSEAKIATLEHTLSQYRLSVQDTLPLLSAWLSLPLPKGRYTALQLTPQQQRQKTLELLRAMVLTLAEQQPVLCIVEDLHWTDPSTLEWLGMLIEQVPTAALMLLLTCRPEFVSPWGQRSHLTPLALRRLSRAQVEGMVQRLTGSKTLPAEVMQHLLDKTDGVPLYIEEMTKAVLESGILQESEGQYELVGPLTSLTIPATLQDSLIARLDRLGAAKGLAQLGATLGRTFAYPMLQAVASQDALDVWRGLVELVHAELLYQRGSLPNATFTFKHALIQDTAYQSLLNRSPDE